MIGEDRGFGKRRAGSLDVYDLLASVRADAIGPHGSLHWHLDDPAEVEGPEERRMEAFRATRTELTVRLRPFIEIARRAAGRLPAIAGPEPIAASAAAGA